MRGGRGTGSRRGGWRSIIGREATVVADGPEIVRFVMPYDAWCASCHNHLSLGVRFNAERRLEATEENGKIYTYDTKCCFCDNPLSFRTDLKAGNYSVIHGCKPRSGTFQRQSTDPIASRPAVLTKVGDLDAMEQLERVTKQEQEPTNLVLAEEEHETSEADEKEPEIGPAMPSDPALRPALTQIRTETTRMGTPDHKVWYREADEPREICYLDIRIGEDYCGRLGIRLFDDHLPKTCENFRMLCKGPEPSEELELADDDDDETKHYLLNRPVRKHYKGTLIHHIQKHRFAIGGDISHGRDGGESIYGGYFEDESFRYQHLRRGLLSMVQMDKKVGCNSNGSQFMICLGPVADRDGKNVVFGEIFYGLDMLDVFSTLMMGSGGKKCHLEGGSRGRCAGRPRDLVCIVDSGVMNLPTRTDLITSAKISAIEQEQSELASYVLCQGPSWMGVAQAVKEGMAKRVRQVSHASDDSSDEEQRKRRRTTIAPAPKKTSLVTVGLGGIEDDDDSQ
eukprot:TRINITY_DN14136_c0_g1_i1.p1 TRINITY_DN14136_c0_g1~~TRINITY_DN14136_c0_g1_i1.p1  ORF type:complete len:516 (+),score=55.95 TRINITY_DN14136_c0_g1_i1:24-1550(+)